jgi:hypothetical protein
MGCLPATTSLSKMYDSVEGRQQQGRPVLPIYVGLQGHVTAGGRMTSLAHVQVVVVVVGRRSKFSSTFDTT